MNAEIDGKKEEMKEEGTCISVGVKKASVYRVSGQIEQYGLLDHNRWPRIDQITPLVFVKCWIKHGVL